MIDCFLCKLPGRQSEINIGTETHGNSKHHVQNQHKLQSINV